MQEIIYNEENINDTEIDEIVIRTKGIIINDNNEILLGYCNKTYQFPGGHLEGKEDLYSCLKREVKEETGIVLTKEYSPFLVIKYYTRNYRNTTKTRLNKIYYYYIKENRTYSLSDMSLDKNEILGNYTLKYIKITNVKNLLKKTVKDNPINKIIVKEMITVLDKLKQIHYY